MNQPLSCGECKACCSLLAVDSLKKPAGQACPHICEIGCSIYANRPKSCRSCECLWLQGACWLEGVDSRPDKLGLMFVWMKMDDIEGLATFEVWPEASTGVNSIFLLDQLLKKEVPLILFKEKVTTLN